MRVSAVFLTAQTIGAPFEFPEASADQQRARVDGSYRYPAARVPGDSCMTRKTLTRRAILGLSHPEIVWTNQLDTLLVWVIRLWPCMKRVHPLYRRLPVTNISLVVLYPPSYSNTRYLRQDRVFQQAYPRDRSGLRTDDWRGHGNLRCHLGQEQVRQLVVRFVTSCRG